MTKLIDITEEYGFGIGKTLVAIIHFETQFPKEWKDEIGSQPRCIKISKIEFSYSPQMMMESQIEQITKEIAELKKLWAGKPITKEEYSEYDTRRKGN